MLTKLFVGAAATIGLALAAVGMSPARTQTAGDCCVLNLACCDTGRACCTDDVKSGCCAAGKACCALDLACCDSAPECCLTGSCCDAGEECCDEAGSAASFAAEKPAGSCCHAADGEATEL